MVGFESGPGSVPLFPLCPMASFARCPAGYSQRTQVSCATRRPHTSCSPMPGLIRLILLSTPPREPPPARPRCLRGPPQASLARQSSLLRTVKVRTLQASP